MECLRTSRNCDRTCSWTPSQGSWAAKIDWAKIKAKIQQHFLPLSFAIAITIALAWPKPGKAVVSITVAGLRLVQNVLMGVVFFLSGLTLDTKELSRAKGHALGVVFGFLSILFLTPCLGFAMREVPLEPKLFSVGLAVYCTVPTTLGAGVAIVRSCYGNEAVALLMVVGTNMLGVLTVPIALKVLFLNYDLSNLEVRVDMLNLLIKLLITILAPSVIGKLARDFIPWVGRHATLYRAELSVFSTTCLAVIVWQTLSGARDLLFESRAVMVLITVALAAAVFCFYLAMNYIIIKYVFKLPTPEAIAVVIISSQKSAPVAVTIFSYLTSDAGELGLLSIPALVGQLTQIFVGSAMVPTISKHAKKYMNAQAKAAAVDAAVALDTAADAESGMGVVISASDLQVSSGTSADVSLQGHAVDKLAVSGLEMKEAHADQRKHVDMGTHADMGERHAHQRGVEEGQLAGQSQVAQQQQQQGKDSLVEAITQDDHKQAADTPPSNSLQRHYMASQGGRL